MPFAEGKISLVCRSTTEERELAMGRLHLPVWRRADETVLVKFVLSSPCSREVRGCSRLHYGRLSIDKRRAECNGAKPGWTGRGDYVIQGNYKLLASGSRGLRPPKQRKVKMQKKPNSFLPEKILIWMCFRSPPPMPL